MEHLTLRLNVGDPQDPDLTLEDLVAQARRIRASLGLQSVNFAYSGVEYSVTRNAVIQTIASKTYSVLPEEAIVNMSKFRKEGS